jgi:transcription elongation factor Elf1
MNNQEPPRYFPCVHCEAESAYPVRLIEEYSGTISRRCTTCGLVSNIQIPRRNDTSQRGRTA